MSEESILEQVRAYLASATMDERQSLFWHVTDGYCGGCGIEQEGRWDCQCQNDA